MFNERLRETRKKCGFTQQNMADKLGISLNAYQKYEQAERSPSLECLVTIADIFDISIDYLLCRDEFISSHVIYVDEH
ncbi:MAG: helix-turn-helix transcriptional regulator [Lachnospira sp.]|jgi:transcriptional regulator with XRE-family HTH domain|nr:helix-turn-helix transcriptional regulator [Lachnospira sp.]